MIKKLLAALIVVLAPLAVYAGSQFFVGASVALCPYYMPLPAQQPTQPQPAYERVVI
jgi:hypothetical protein